MNEYNEEIRILKEPPGDGSYKLTKEQERLRAEGKSIYKSDRVVKKFTVRKGKFV